MPRSESLPNCGDDQLVHRHAVALAQRDNRGSCGERNGQGEKQGQRNESAASEPGQVQHRSGSGEDRQLACGQRPKHTVVHVDIGRNPDRCGHDFSPPGFGSLGGAGRVGFGRSNGRRS